MGALIVAIIATGVPIIVRHPNATLMAAPADYRARHVQDENSLPAGFLPPVGHAIPDGAATPVTATPPVELAVPVIGVRTLLEGLRLNGDGTLQTPVDWDHAGWYSNGSAPGEPGAPAIIVGHVDSTAGPAVFFRLQDLRPGDPILIRQANGQTVRFVVYKTEQFAKAAFPALQVYAPARSPEIRLITCTGVFDRTTRHYLGNFVVYAAAPPIAQPAATKTAAVRPAAVTQPPAGGTVADNLT